MPLNTCTDEIAALVGLDDDAVGLVVVIGGDRGMRPGGGVAALDGAVADDVAAPVDAEAGDDDAAAVGAGGRGDRRIDGDDDARELGPGGEAAWSSQWRFHRPVMRSSTISPSSSWRPIGGVGVAALHLGQEGRRQVGGVVGGARAVGDGGLRRP